MAAQSAQARVGWACKEGQKIVNPISIFNRCRNTDIVRDSFDTTADTAELPLFGTTTSTYLRAAIHRDLLVRHARLLALRAVVPSVRSIYIRLAGGPVIPLFRCPIFRRKEAKKGQNDERSGEKVE